MRLHRPGDAEVPLFRFVERYRGEATQDEWGELAELLSERLRERSFRLAHREVMCEPGGEPPDDPSDPEDAELICRHLSRLPVPEAPSNRLRLVAFPQRGDEPTTAHGSIRIPGHPLQHTSNTVDQVTLRYSSAIARAMAAPIRSAVASMSLSAKCAYRNVICTLLWPSSRETTGTGTPFMTAWLAREWRMSGRGAASRSERRCERPCDATRGQWVANHSA